jgi:hypothetical protein
MYILGLFPDKPELWTQTAVARDYWESQNQAVKLAELMQLSKITSVSQESVRVGNQDVPCNVLQIEPDPAKLWSIIISQPGIQLPSSAPSGVAFNRIIKYSELKTWTSQTSGFPLKAVIQMNIVVGPAEVSTLTSDVSMAVNIEMWFSDYNQATPITLPEEAKEATDLNIQKATPKP